jgi:toxin ParE1/3/4
MRRVDLSPRARDDIISIAAYGIEAFGSAQAHLYQDEMFRQFELLAEFPRLGRPLEPPHTKIHRFGYGSHIILYTIADDSITVGRILHGRMDVTRVLDELG